MRLTSVSLIVIAGLAASAGAQNIKLNSAGLGGITPPPGNDSALWDQSGFDGNLAATVDQNFNDFPSFSTFQVDDFTTGGQTWNVSKITTYYTKRDGIGFWNNSINQGSVQVYSKSGSLPLNGDVAPEYSVPITLTDGGGYWIATADTSGIAELQGINGDYWVGLTPTAAFGQYGQEFHLQLQNFYGENAAIRNPGGGFGLGANWVSNTAIGGFEMAYKLEGDVVPAPGAFALLGLGGLAAGRRRRA